MKLLTTIRAIDGVTEIPSFETEPVWSMVMNSRRDGVVASWTRGGVEGPGLLMLNPGVGKTRRFTVAPGEASDKVVRAIYDDQLVDDLVRILESDQFDRARIVEAVGVIPGDDAEVIAPYVRTYLITGEVRGPR